ncbi:MAG TPA: hypothetical protein EYM49_05215 [Campylobacterales bacterium]|nr:hypothetical protein [Campylobacterales bacterium]
MPYIKFIPTLLILTTFSFSQSDIIIDPFSNPSVIYQPSVEVKQTYQEEEITPSFSDDIINPFKKQNLIQGDAQQIETQIEPIYQEQGEATISPLIIEDTQPSYQQTIDTTRAINNIPKYQRAKNQAQLDAQALPPSDKESLSYNSTVPDIQGNYKFLKGTKGFGSGVIKEIEDGYLVIEKLDDNNFGYYYTFYIEKSSPLKYFGIFNYDKGAFHQRVIKNEGSTVTENLTNTKIVTDGMQLELEVDIEGGPESTIWEYGSIDYLSEKLKKSLKEAKKDYKEIYKDKFSQLTY